MFNVIRNSRDRPRNKMRVHFALSFFAAILLVVEVLGQSQLNIFTGLPTTNNMEIATPKPCVTARREEGTCVGRERCDYGTEFIDFTLYVPRGYVSKCTGFEVCCPPSYVIPAPERLFRFLDEDYDFDEDD